MTEAVLIMISCVLFVQMGLSGAITEALHTDLPIVSCPKCLTWWICLMYLVSHEYGIIESVAASFILSYAALWLALLYDCLAVLYNKTYDKLSKTNDTSEDAEADNTEADAYEVSEM